ncbi:MAG: tRNA pseudouridine(55) synthase TruB [Sediminibacterium sp.]|jgi:tRNA pseudouridine55 synthase|nr:tRNA pseudouridine(55) synthase TruB [Chitinophagaceae bacterium]MCA6445942.1 tRNA pseudouridine(55) synthase TruB [Chitinophagaceae bacterium]
MRQKPIHPSLQSFLEGELILIDKPLGWTSFDVVRKIRNLTKVIKVGHAGTLDPLATGLLIVCTGKFTKKINEYMGMPKTYTGTFTIGATTPTYDLESEPVNFKTIDSISASQIQQTTKQFMGDILQIPPIHSAIKRDGKPVYLAARKGEDIVLEPRPVTIYDFAITAIQLPILHFLVRCSTGTYIRSLAHDFGQALGTGAYMSSLRRTHIGAFEVHNAYSMETFEEKIQSLIALEG